MTKKKLYIKTYGCQMNVYDSMMMEGLLKPYGYEMTESVEDSDMVVLNTCHIREKASEKMYSELGRIKKRKKNKDDYIITVAGCVAQAEGEEIFKRAPYVDIVVGPQSYQTLPDLISQAKRKQGHVINLEFEDSKFDKLPTEESEQGVSAFLSVQEGCDKFCTFCVVPYTRGAEYSREVPKLYREAIKLVASGAKEINLLGQNVNAFHGKSGDDSDWNLGQLIKHLSTINGLKRIRYQTSHPRDMHEDLYEAHANIQQLMPFLNLPVQSGSNKILKAMNRKHTREEYFAIIERLRNDRPDMQFSTDIIVGFPGETEKDFLDTVDLVKRVNYTQAYSFKYSIRPGTPGAEMENQVAEAAKDERLQELQKIINEQQFKFNRDSVGKTMEVLLEKQGKKPGQLVGKTPYMQSVHVISENHKIGDIINVKIIGGGPNSLEGQV